MQGALIGYRTGQQGFVIGLGDNRKAAEPVRPIRVQDSLDPDPLTLPAAQRISVGHRLCLLARVLIGQSRSDMERDWPRNAVLARATGHHQPTGWTGAAQGEDPLAVQQPPAHQPGRQRLLEPLFPAGAGRSELL